MPVGENRSQRELAVAKIVIARKSEVERQRTRDVLLNRRAPRSKKKQKIPPLVRLFKKPSIIFRANDIAASIDWNLEQRTAPPLLDHLSADQLKELIKLEDPTQHECFPKLPCHTQNVERHIKTVTRAAAVVAGQAKRDAHIRATLKHRAWIPIYHTKRQYRLSVRHPRIRPRPYLGRLF